MKECKIRLRKILNKKAFTLIELLAVIVILAIIALIATPIVLGIINGSKDSANERSIDLYAKSIVNSIARYQLNNGNISPGRYQTDDGKILTKGDVQLTVEYSGNAVICDVINIYDDGQVYLSNCNVGLSDVDYTYGPQYYPDGTPVYFNVTSGEVCQEDEAISNTEPNSGCMKFYAFNDTSSKELNMILDHNTTSKLSWVDFTDQLNEDTSGWNVNSTRIISVEEIINDIIGDKSWNKTDWEGSYYIESSSNSLSDTCRHETQNPITGVTTPENMTGCKYRWLVENLSSNSELPNGYWTLSGSEDDFAFAVTEWFIEEYPTYSEAAGIRPVVTVLKSQLK